MPRYPEERKQAILVKMSPPESRSIPELAAEEGISTATLYNWRKAERQRGAILPSNSATPDQWSSQDKFQAVPDTAALTQAELSIYCRTHGLYQEQIERWKAACVAGNDHSDGKARSQAKTQREDRKRIRRLEAEVRRKDAALAETAALLTLSKKAEAIWGHKPEDD